MSRKSRHQYILDKAKAAAFAAISCYNQPMFTYREESFSILMANAWELLLKANIVKNNNEQRKSIYKINTDAKRKNGKPYRHPKYHINDAKNPITISFRDIVRNPTKFKLEMTPDLIKHLETFYVIRNANIHFVKTDLGLIYLEVFTATLQSFKVMLKQWFDEDISDKLILMPVAFNLPDHFDAKVTSNEVKKILNFIAKQEQSITKSSDHNIRMNVEVTIKRSQNGIPVITKSKDGVPIHVKEDDAFKNKYYWSCKDDLIPRLKKYSNFKANKTFWKALKLFKKDLSYCKKRSLNLHKKGGVSQWYYSPNIVKPLVKELGLRE